MDYVSGKLRHFSNYFWKVKEEPRDDGREISRFEVYIEYSYKILSWEEPSLSWISFLVLNFLFWLMVQFELRILGVVFLTALIAFVGDFYFDKTHTEPLYSQHSEAIQQLCTTCSKVVFTLKSIRKESPSSFCIVMCILFLVCSFIAKNVSGYVLFYLFILNIFFLPLLFTKIPPEHLETMKQFFSSFTSDRGMLAEDELIPFISGKDFNARDPELDSLLTDKTADSVSNSLISGISAMPSYVDVDELPDEIDEAQLIPDQYDKVSKRRRRSQTPDLPSSDDDSEVQEMHFDSTHFNGDTSSEDEKLFGKGLKFTDADASDTVTQSKQAARGLSGMLSDVATSVGTRLVSNIMQVAASVPAKSTRKDSSSDSDFEIINTDEVDEHHT